MPGERATVVSSFTVIKGSMIEETYATFRGWDFSRSREANLETMKATNAIGAKSANWLRDVAFVLHRRFDPEHQDRPLVELAQAVEAMGTGEILLNCIDRDGTNSGFDLELIEQVKGAVKIPVIASSGAGNPAHFQEIFEKTRTDAALGAGMFHRGEYTVQQVKDYLGERNLEVRQFEGDL